jgi:hypothetical protein
VQHSIGLRLTEQHNQLLRKHVRNLIGKASQLIGARELKGSKIEHGAMVVGLVSLSDLRNLESDVHHPSTRAMGRVQDDF